MNTNPDTGKVKVPVIYVDALRLNLPYFHSVEAGFPSPADDFIEEELNLEDHLIKNREATFFLRVRGKSMLEAGLFPDAILVVDRSLTPKNNDTVIAALDGEFTVKYYYKPAGAEEVHLNPGNPEFKPIIIREDNHWMFMIWGVVTYVIHKPQPPQ